MKKEFVESLNTFTTALKHKGFTLVEKEPGFRLYVKKTPRKSNHICIEKDYSTWCITDSSWDDFNYEPIIGMSLARMNKVLKSV